MQSSSSGQSMLMKMFNLIAIQMFSLRKLKKIKGRYNLPEQPLEVDGKETTNVREKAEIFAKTFSSVSKNSSLSQEQLSFSFREREKSCFEQPTFLRNRTN